MNLPAGVRRLLRLHDAERDVADELAFHFEEAVAELQARGLSEAAAREEAERRFGNVASYRRQLARIDRGRLSDERRAHRLDAVRDVVVHAVRSVIRSPALSHAVVITLALGLGASVSVYGIVDRLLLSPPPYVTAPESVRRVMVDEFRPWSGERGVREHLPFLTLADLEGASSLDALALWQETTLTTGHGLDARQIDGVMVSGGYFELRGVRPAFGRLIGASDDAADAEPTAVISYEMWQREHAGAPDVLGRTLTFGTTSYTIIGITPPGFTTLRLGSADVWLPAHHAATQSMRDGRQWLSWGGVARLHAGVSDAAAADELTALMRRAVADQPQSAVTEPVIALTPIIEARGPTAQPEARVAAWIAGVSLVLLLIACVNVANLLLARMLRQRHETAVRLALGVSRRRLVSQVLLEGLLLGLLGGVAALVLAYWSTTAMGTVLLPHVAWDRLAWQPLHVPLTLLAAAAVGILAALIPALQSTRVTVAHGLREGRTGSRGTARLRMSLSLAQAALSVVLLVGAGLFVRSLDSVRNMDLGYRLANLQYLEILFTPGSVTPDEASQLRQQVLDRVRAHPLVSGAAAASTGPFRWVMINSVHLPGRDSLPSIGSQGHHMFQVTPEYFSLMDMRFVAGRPFDERDVRSGTSFAVINETMARALWPDGDPLGACILVDGPQAECTFVVGVVRDARFSHIREEGVAQYYLPLTVHHGSTMVLARANGRSGVADELRAAAVAIDPRIRLVRITPASEAFAPQERQYRLGATVFTAFGLLALLVAALGLYAVLAFDVSQRTREIGIRGALGADRWRVVRLVLRQALLVASAGVLLGAAAAALLAPRLEDMLFQVSPHDAGTYGFVALSLLIVAAAAAVIPARRAAAVDPAVALRSE